MRGLANVIALLALTVGAGAVAAAWCGFLVAVGIHVARWFL